jgi:hypothetical protein
MRPASLGARTNNDSCEMLPEIHYKKVVEKSMRKVGLVVNASKFIAEKTAYIVIRTVSKTDKFQDKYWGRITALSIYHLVEVCWRHRT